MPYPFRLARPSAFVAVLSSALALSALLATATPAEATTFQRVSDRALARQAAAVVEVRVVDFGPSPSGTRPATDYIVEVERVVKGDVEGSSLVVRVPGGVGPDGLGLKVWGAPELQLGETALLFLRPAADGTWRVLHLMLGAFHVRPAPYGGGGRVAFRDFSDAHEVGPGGRFGPGRDELRDLERFIDFVAREDGAAPETPEAGDAGEGYVVGVAPDSLESTTGSFTLLQSDRGTPIRWFRFDRGETVEWRVHRGGQPGLDLPATTAAFQVALRAWIDDRGSQVRYAHAGTTSAANGLARSDGVNAILFDDPLRNDPDEAVEGTFSCRSGGVVAIGGPFFYTSTRTWNGKGYHEAVEADIVTNDGTECLFRGNPRAAEEVFAHELGHTLGLGHSGTFDALMWPNIHDDGRGARLASDDRAAVASLYPSGTPVGPEPSGPAAPTNLSARAVSATQIALAWRDNAGNETGYRVERKAGGSFREVLALPAGATAATVSGLQAGTSYTFRVRAAGPGGLSSPSNTASASTPAAPAAPAAASGVAALARSPREVLLTWSSTASSVSGFRIEQDAGGGFQPAGTAPAGARSALVRNLSPSTSYRFRLVSEGSGGASAPSGIASATTPAGAESTSCSGSAALCLLDGKLRVEVLARNQHAGGVAVQGRAVSRTETTGTFWFFDSGNVELVVKALDGRAVNGSYWVFAGPLTDLEYWIRVTETATGRVRVYHNRPGDTRGFADTSALGVADAATVGAAVVPVLEVRALAAPVSVEVSGPAPSSPSAACRASADALCLLDGRVRVEVGWRNQHDGGATGKGGALPGGDNAGFFWFFDPSNVELVVKALDGTAINGRLWVFFAAVSDVEIEVRVTDTATGKTRVYRTPPGAVAGVADTSAL
jgi:hypothetical protein